MRHVSRADVVDASVFGRGTRGGGSGKARWTHRRPSGGGACCPHWVSGDAKVSSRDGSLGPRSPLPPAALMMLAPSWHPRGAPLPCSRPPSCLGSVHHAGDVSRPRIRRYGNPGQKIDDENVMAVTGRGQGMGWTMWAGVGSSMASIAATLAVIGVSANVFQTVHKGVVAQHSPPELVGTVMGISGDASLLLVVVLWCATG